MINFFEELEEKLKLPIIENGIGFKIVYLINAVYLEGHKGILFLGEDEISFKLKKGKVCFFGKKLEISKLDLDTALIKGIVTKIEREGDNA